MKRFLLSSMLLLLFSLGMASDPAAAEGPSERAQYLERLLAAIRSMPVGELQRLEAEGQNLFTRLCRSSDPSLALSCAFEGAAKICQASSDGQGCLLFMDALIVERLNTNRFITTRERYEMMSQGSDYKRTMDRALRHRYGSLAHSFSLGSAGSCAPSDFTCLGEKLEIFCQNEANMGRLSYQSCASVIALYIGRIK